MNRLIEWIARKLDMTGFSAWEIRDYEHVVREMEDIIAHLKRSQKRPVGFDESLEYAEGVLDGIWTYEGADKGLHLETARQDLHTMMQGRAEMKFY